MRLLYYSDSYTPHDYRILSTLQSLGWEIEFCTKQAAIKFVEQRQLPDKITWHCVGDNSDVAISFLRQTAEKCRVALAGPLHGCAWEFSETGFHPWMAVSWAYDLLELTPKNPELKKRVVTALSRADALFCDAAAVRRAAEKFGDWSKRIVVQIPWGLDLQKFSTISPSTAWPGDDWSGCKVWISTRNWSPVYDPLTTLRGFQLAHQSDPSLRLIMAGGGPEEGKVASFLKEQNLKALVFCPGTLPNEELLPWVQSAHFYLSSSQCDGSSVSMLEAMACGLPVLVVDNDSNREWVQPGLNGCLFSAGDYHQLASAMLEISQWPKSKIKSVTVENQRLVRSRADWQVNAKLLSKALETLSQAQGVSKEWEAPTA